MRLSPSARARLTIASKLLHILFRILTFLACALAALASASAFLDIRQLPGAVPILITAIFAVAGLRKMNASRRVNAPDGSSSASGTVQDDSAPDEASIEPHAQTFEATEHGPSQPADADVQSDEHAESRDTARRIIERHRVALLGFGIATALAQEYAWDTRSLRDFSSALWLGAGGLACLHLALAFRARLRDLPTLASAAVSGALLGSFAGLSCYGLIAAITDAVHTLVHSPPATRAAVVLILGVFLYGARRWLRAVYGLTEVTLGVFLGGRQLAGVPLDALAARPEVAIAALTAGIYLVVRGLDNVEQGICKSPRDAMWTALRAYYLAAAARVSDRLQRRLLGTN